MSSRRVIVSKQKLAGFFGVTPRWINRLADELGMPKVARGEFDLIACSRWYLRYLSGLIESRDRGDGTAARLRQQNRIKLAKIRVERVRHKREALENTFLSLTTTRQVIPEFEGRLREALTEALEAVAPHAATSEGVVLKAVLKEASHDALRRAQTKIQEIKEPSTHGETKCPETSQT